MARGVSPAPPPRRRQRRRHRRPDRRWAAMAVPGTGRRRATDRRSTSTSSCRSTLNAPDVPDDNPTGLYRRTFRVPTGVAPAPHRSCASGRPSRWRWVWVNGVRRSRQGQPPAVGVRCHRPPATRRQRRCAIVVPQWSDASWIEDQDQWWMPGLHRSVELVSTPPIASPTPRCSRPRRGRHDRHARRSTCRRRADATVAGAHGRGAWSRAGRRPRRGPARRAVPVPRSTTSARSLQRGCAGRATGCAPASRCPDIAPWSHETPAPLPGPRRDLRDGDERARRAVARSSASGRSRSPTTSC